jgi:hypothetical protein
MRNAKYAQIEGFVISPATAIMEWFSSLILCQRNDSIRYAQQRIIEQLSHTIADKLTGDKALQKHTTT